MPVIVLAMLLPSEQCKENEYNSQVLLNGLYTHHVNTDSSSIIELETTKKGQSNSKTWVRQHKLCITASVMNKVFHHRPHTSCDSFVKRNSLSNPVRVPAIECGRKNEQKAISSYLNDQKSDGKIIKVKL